jgi:N-acetyl-alpha-D-muramate 1-phosphate uridylyltransferase
VSSALFPVAILAGGLATRLRRLTANLPKALVDVNGEPFIAHQLRLLERRGVTEVVLCLGHRGELVQEYVGSGARFGLHIDYSFDGPRLLGTAGALLRARPLLGPAFFVLYGDSYLPCDYARVQRDFERRGCLGLMTVYRNEGKWDRSNVEFAHGAILAYDKRRPTARMRHIDYGLGVLDRRALDLVPADQPSDLADLYRALLERRQLAACEVAERFYEIGSPAGLEATRHHLAAQAGLGARSGEPR